MNNRFISALINVLIWIAVFFLTILPITMKLIPESPMTSFLSFLIPSLAVIFLRTGNKRTYAIWTTIFLAIPLMHAYLVQATAPPARFYYEALGASLLGGLLGFAVIRGIDWASNRKVSAAVPRYGQYILGMALYSIVGIPLMQQQEREEVAAQEVQSEQAREIGVLAATCDAVEHLKLKRCPGLNISDDLNQVCKSEIHEFVPADMQPEIKVLLAGDSMKTSFMNNRNQIDGAIENALANGQTPQQVCSGLEVMLDQAFTRSWERLSAAKASN